MKLEAIILDIDGTLCNSEKRITTRTKNVLIKAQEQGVKVILASGRPTRGLYALADELELNKYHGLVVSYNGACVVDIQTGDIHYQKPLSVEQSKRILEHVKKFDVITMLEDDDYICVNDVYNNEITIDGNPLNVIAYESRCCNYLLKEVSDLADYVSKPQNKIQLAGTDSYLQEVWHEIAEPFEGEIDSMFTSPFYYEFTARGVNKGEALGTVFEKLDVNVENTISFGDGQNDESIIRLAKVGVAMGNAIDELKEIADRVTLTNDEDGVAVVLEEYIK